MADISKEGRFQTVGLFRTFFGGNEFTFRHFTFCNKQR